MGFVQQCNMCNQRSLRSACAFAQSDQSLCLSLDYSMSVKLLTEHHLEFLILKKSVQPRLSLHLSKYHIFGNHMSRLNYVVQYFSCVSSPFFGLVLYFLISFSSTILALVASSSAKGRAITLAFSLIS